MHCLAACAHSPCTAHAVSRAVWSAGGTLRRQYTAHSDILQAAWARFQELGGGRVLCLLHRLSVTTLTPSGEVHETPLLQPCTALWPLERGLLLVVSPAAGPRPTSQRARQALAPRARGRAAGA